MKAIVQGGATIASLGERILGRTTAEDIIDSKNERGRSSPRARCSMRPMITRIEAIGTQACQDPLAARSARASRRRLRGLLRARSRPRYAGEHRRSRRRHRGAVDRRAGHPADDADLPHRRRGPAQRAVEPRSGGRRHGRAIGTCAIDRRSARSPHVAMARNGEVAIVDMDGRERATHRIPYGAYAAGQPWARSSPRAIASPSGIPS